MKIGKIGTATILCFFVCKGRTFINKKFKKDVVGGNLSPSFTSAEEGIKYLNRRRRQIREKEKG